MMRAAAFILLFTIAAAPGYAAGEPTAGSGAHSLRMEELEVRGLREKPAFLYLPVHRGMVLPSPVRYDLFLVDMARPVLPSEIPTETPPIGGITEQGASSD